MSRGYYRSYGEVYPNTMDMEGNIISIQPDHRITYLDYDTIRQRFVSGRLTGDDETDFNRYDYQDLNRVLLNYGQEIPVDPFSLSNLGIMELCNLPTGIEYMENTFNIDADLICDNTHNCSEPSEIWEPNPVNLPLLCPDGQGSESNILNPFRVFCDLGINCSNNGLVGGCISTINSGNECIDLEEEDCNSTDGCKYDKPTYNYPCIILSNRCKDDEICSNIMNNISEEIRDTNDISQNTFRECRENENCRNVMDCTLTNITTNGWSLRGQCTQQPLCDETILSWPCLVIEDESYYRCNSLDTPQVFNNYDCYCSGVEDQYGGSGYEKIRNLDETVLNGIGVDLGLTETGEDLIRKIAGYNTFNVDDNIPQETINLIRELQNPLCEMVNNQGVPYCYTSPGTCIDGIKSNVKNGYETSYEACNFLSLNRISNNSQYNSDTWPYETPGGYWKHFIVNDYGGTRECNNIEKTFNNKCIPCGDQVGCIISDEYSTCIHLGNQIFAKECEIGHPHINNLYGREP